MRSIFFASFILLSIYSCKKGCDKRSANFYNIDISRSDGWHGFYSLNIDSSGFLLLKRVQSKDEKYYTGKLNDTTLNEIIDLTDSILVTRYDSTFAANCLDCSIYKIVLNSKQQQFNRLVPGHHSLKYVDRLINIYTGISKSSNLKQVDTSYDFESFHGFLPKMSEKIFVPPVID